MTAANQPILLGMGNPLLDIAAEVDPSLLEKYGLEANNAILADATHMPLYQELIASYEVEYVAGGATQNSIRGAQWLMPANKTAYIGCVGKDHFADKLASAAAADGVATHYMKTDEVPTGTCAVLITKKGAARSLVANLSAAEKYKVDHLQQPETWAVVEGAKYYYISGFFLTVSPPSIMAVAKHAAENNKTFCMNLSAPFVSQFFTQPLDAAIPYMDYLFGNETEAAAFAEAHGWAERDVKEIAKKIVTMPKVNGARSDDVIVATLDAQGNVTAEDHPIIPVAKEQIVDTNGAGDAFVGGFLAELAQERDIDTCIKAGMWAAHIVIQQSGPVYPKNIEKPQDFAKLNYKDV
ncbi:Ribokinase-like protein [Catenaria anguillulae PL171]|uniref:Adenosine kinase n=1 Tax=Catenaria anguillulae PL171 TaxID=765915 RepID=A0A1Y2HT82_9FUNG|nr:Ribokinase-like protein [Catenaria anguillulae PL171]